MRIVGFFSVLFLAGAFLAPVFPADEGLDARLFRSAQELYRAGKIEQALHDFKEIVKNYPASSYADDALYEIARHAYPSERVGEFQPSPDPNSARSLFSRIADTYPKSDKAPFALTHLGMLDLDPMVAPPALNDAYANFLRVLRLYPKSTACDAATFGLGLTLSLQNDGEGALSRFFLLPVLYPDSAYVPASYYQSALLFARNGHFKDAMGQLALLQAAFPNDVFAQKARNLATLVYRFAFSRAYRYKNSFSLMAGEHPLRRVTSFRAAASGSIWVADPGAKAVFQFKANGKQTASFPAEKPYDAWRAKNGKLYIADGKNALVDSKPLTLYKDTPAELINLERITLLLATRRGEMIGFDRQRRTLYLFGSDGKAVKTFAQKADVSALDMDFRDRVFTLDARNKIIRVFSHEGAETASIPAKGKTYAFQSPTAMALDLLGNLYVLDSRQGAVLVFDPKLAFRSQVSFPKGSPGELKRPSALCVLSDGSLLVFDESSAEVKRYE